MCLGTFSICPQKHISKSQHTPYIKNTPDQPPKRIVMLISVDRWSTCLICAALTLPAHQSVSSRALHLYIIPLGHPHPQASPISQPGGPRDDLRFWMGCLICNDIFVCEFNVRVDNVIWCSLWFHIHCKVVCFRGHSCRPNVLHLKMLINI